MKWDVPPRRLSITSRIRSDDVRGTYGCKMLVDGVEVVAYANNDGGLWYYHPVTGTATTVKETDHDSRNIRDREEQGA